MAIKKLILPSTGIYQQKITSVSIQGPPDFEGLCDAIRLLEMRPEENQLLPSMSELETKARQAVLEYVSDERGEAIDENSWVAVDRFIRDILKRAREDIHKKFQSPVSQEQSRKLTRGLIKVERANDACNMLHHLAVIHGQLKRGSAEVAVSHAVWLGMAYERLKIREFEPNAWTGQRTRQGASKGGHAKNESAQVRYKEIALAFSKRRRLSQKAFARSQGISLSTLKRVLKKPGSLPAK